MQLQQKAKNINFVFFNKAHAVLRGRILLRGLLPPSLRALIAQVAASLFTLVFLAPGFGLIGIDFSLILAAVIQGALAAAMGSRLGLAPWWLPIHLLFAPAIVWMLSFGISPQWFFALFLLLCLVYWSVFRSQVPLYLSSHKAREAVADLLPVKSKFAFLDVGAGLGGMLGYLSGKRPDGQFYGMEIAPLPFALAWLRKMACRGGYQIRWGDFWTSSLAAYDVVYAYLSPVPMGKLWAKACAEMAPGTRFISNTFSIPGEEPEEIVVLDDFHRSRLYVYIIPTRQPVEMMP